LKTSGTHPVASERLTSSVRKGARSSITVLSVDVGNGSRAYYQKDIDTLEKVQRMVTKMIKDIQHLSYEDRLKKLNLYFLVRRRKRGDLIVVFKSLNNLEYIDEEIIFNRSLTTNLRGHDCKLFKVIPRSCVAETFFQSGS